MFSSFTGDEAVFDFDELANLLLEQGLSASPSELHGCLCGLLAAGAAPAAEVGVDGLNQALDMDVHGELAGQVMDLYASTAQALEDDAFEFYPLLPDDDIDIVTRTAAMAGWCRGFLAGYAQVSAAGQRAVLPGDSSEILRDLAAIAAADVDELEADEEAENSYAELNEYIRFAALNAYMDNRIEGGAGGTTPGPGGRQLH